jgi:hypothetical protein
MGQIDITLKLDDIEYPILKKLKKKELDKYLIKIFKTGYQIHFPSSGKQEQQVEYNELIERIETIKDELKDEINNSDISDKINLLESSLSKLIGLSSNSCKKGSIGENVLEEIITKRYGDIQFEKKNHVPHSGDAWLYLPDNKIIMLESKNYTTTVNKDEITKLKNDMVTHHIKWGILASFNSNIQGMKELDFYTFTNNNETYSIIMISNLVSDIHKLDLGLQIIRKLIGIFDNIHDFPWIVSDITHSLEELNQLIQKNYLIRDNFYNMEREMQKLMSSFHSSLRDYQYDIEQKINEITKKINSTLVESVKINNIDQQSILLETYKDKKIFPLIVRIVDVVQTKKWKLNYNEDSNEWLINNKDVLKIQAKKISINIPNNDISINFHLNKDKENKQNIEILKSL